MGTNEGRNASNNVDSVPSACKPPIICLSTPFSTRPTRVARNQHQSLNFSAVEPIRLPSKPNLDQVAISSAMAFVSSSSTGGGAYNRVWRKGFLILAAFSVVISAEKGTDCCARIWDRGCNQLKSRRSFLC